MTTMTASIKCGNCKGTHGSVTEVKACYNANTVGTATYAEGPVTWATAPAAPAVPLAFEAKATAKQIDFIARLRAERHLPSTATGLGHLTKKQASSMIEELLAMPKPAPASASQAPSTGKAVEGMHKVGTEIFKVQKAVHGSGHLYAKRLVPGEGYGSKARFVYAPGILKTLSAETLMTLEEAKAWGALYGTCCVCGRTLTNEESIEAGIGPICASKF